MKIIVQKLFDPSSIRHGLGLPDYSYYFVQAAYLPVLETLGEVVHAVGLDDIDAAYEACARTGEGCVFLCFQPPYRVPLGLRCPTIPVFAWEFTTIPCEQLDGDPRSDWRQVFAACGRAIALSQESAALVRAAMGEAFPVFAIPAPSFDRFASIGAPRRGERTVSLVGHVFDTRGDERFGVSRVWPHLPHPVFPQEAAAPALESTPELGSEPVIAAPLPPAPEPPPCLVIEPPPRKRLRARLSLTVQYAVGWYRDVVRDLLPAPVRSAMSLAGRTSYIAYRRVLPLPVPPTPEPAPVAAEPVPEPLSEPTPTPPAPPPAIPPPMLPDNSVTLSGVVYASVLSPQDGRKNWTDMVSGFVWALRDHPDATLIVKMPAKDARTGFHDHFDGWLQQLAPFRCRVIAIYGFLDDDQYDNLVGAADFYVNTSSAEGLCLPLMEFLSAGRPALAPDHSAMADYLTPENAFILAYSREHNVWPQDPSERYTTMRHRLNWQSLADAYGASFALASEESGGYAAMARHARDSMRAFCAAAVVRERLRAALPAEPPSFEQAEAAE